MPSTGADTTGTEENNTATMIEANADGDGQQYYSNESLEDKNSTTSSAEGSINVERRKVRNEKKKKKRSSSLTRSLGGVLVTQKAFLEAFESIQQVKPSSSGSLFGFGQTC